MRSGGQILIDQLVRHGVEVIYGVPGESYLAALDALHDVPIRFVNARHEAGAANMAAADGKLTGRPGVCFVTRGPGAMHGAVGVHTAFQDSAPMLYLVGQVPRGERGREALQEVDFRSTFAPLCKWSEEVIDARRLPELVRRAFQVATSGRPGPVVLSLPEDVLAARDLPDQVEHRRGVLERGVHTDRTVHRSRTPRDEAHAGRTGELPVGGRHVRRARLVAGVDEPDRRIVQRIQRREIALAGNPVDQPDAVADELIDQDLPARAQGVRTCWRTRAPTWRSRPASRAA